MTTPGTPEYEMATNSAIDSANLPDPVFELGAINEAAFEGTAEYEAAAQALLDAGGFLPNMT